MDPKEIETVYQKLRLAMRACFQAGEAAIDARAKLKQSYLLGLTEARIIGSNDTMREACARQLMPDLYAVIAEAEREERGAKLVLDVAQAYVDELRARLRLEELQTREQGIATAIAAAEEKPPF